MSSLKICCVCLRTDVELQELDDNLSDFFDVLCDYSNDNFAQFSCTSCEHVLKECYSFKRQCQKADEVLRNWKKKKSRDRPLVHELYQQLPPFHLNNNKTIPKSVKTMIENIDTVDIKIESDTENIDDQFKVKTELNDVSNGNHHLDYDDDHQNDDNGHQNDDGDHQNEVGGHQNEVVDHQNKDGGHQSDNVIHQNDDVSHQNDDEDDKCLSEFLSIVKAGKQQNEPKIKLNRPRKSVTNQKEYETVFDIQTFNTEAEVQREFEQRHTLERYTSAQHKCTTCFTVYKSKKLLDFHMRWHDPSAGDFICKLCKMRFKKCKTLRTHKYEVHSGLYKCKLCPLVTYYTTVMMNHYQKHTGVQFMCSQCDGVYHHFSTYMTHLRKSHVTEHVCVTCARTFVSDFGLMAHRKTVHKTTSKYDSNGTATCTDCKITFATHAVYIVHVLNTPKHKDLASAIIGCPDCGLQFEDKLMVRAHRRKYHLQHNYSYYIKMAEKKRNGDERVFKCTLCGASGTQNTWLYRHNQAAHPAVPYEQLYNERRSHLCDECGRSFRNITALSEHKHIHTGAKPYSCDKCPAKFRKKTSLKLHVERHLPPARECKHCGKKFVSASNLNNHMRTHIGNRRFKCEICSKGFLHSAALSEHIRGVHHHIRRARKHALKNLPK